MGPLGIATPHLYLRPHPTLLSPSCLVLFNEISLVSCLGGGVLPGPGLPALQGQPLGIPPYPRPGATLTCASSTAIHGD